VTIAKACTELADGKAAPQAVEVGPARLAAADYVSADDPRLWGWVIFPQGFRAPAMMELAKRQAWTLKPAILAASREFLILVSMPTCHLNSGAHQWLHPRDQPRSGTSSSA